MCEARLAMVQPKHQSKFYQKFVEKFSSNQDQSNKNLNWGNHTKTLLTDNNNWYNDWYSVSFQSRRQIAKFVYIPSQSVFAHDSKQTAINLIWFHRIKLNFIARNQIHYFSYLLSFSRFFWNFEYFDFVFGFANYQMSFMLNFVIYFGQWGR